MRFALVLGGWLACGASDASPPAAVADPPPPPTVELAPPLAAPPAPALAVTERLLPWDAEREALSVAYLRERAGIEAVEARIQPQVVVLHWTGGPTAESAWQTFAPTKLAGRPELSGGGALNVSAHYLIDRDGTVLRLLPEDRLARHVIGLNHVAIGIEHVGDGASWPLTPAQEAASAALVRELAGRWPIGWLIGHHEYRQMEATELFRELDPAYRTVKSDPGAAFVSAVYARVADLGLRRAP